MSDNCVKCQKELSLATSKYELSDGYLCKDCAEQHGITNIDDSMKFDNISIDLYLKERKKLKDIYKKTHLINSNFEFDIDNKIFRLTKSRVINSSRDYFKFSELQSYNTDIVYTTTTAPNPVTLGLQSGELSIVTKGAGSLPSTITTQHLNSARVHLILNTTHMPTYTLDVYLSGTITGWLTTDSSVDGKVKEITDALDLILNDTTPPVENLVLDDSVKDNKTKQQIIEPVVDNSQDVEQIVIEEIPVTNEVKSIVTSNGSLADELEKLKKLYDDGAITKKEYTLAKGKVLGIK